MPVIVTSDPEIFNAIMVKNFDCFYNRNISVTMTAEEGEQGRRVDFYGRQKLAKGPTHTSTNVHKKRLRIMASLIEEYCRRLKDKIAVLIITLKLWNGLGLIL